MTPDRIQLPSTGGTTASRGLIIDRPLRVLLYSHDSWGLGHLRRSLAIATAITAEFSQCDVLLVTGSPCATQFDIPLRCDILKLPAVSKDIEGQYVPRSLSGGITRTLELRSRLIHESYRSFDPQLIIIDHQLIGMHGEALGMLRQAREENKAIIYGMRDVLDEPEVVARAWDSHEHHWALKHGYDRVCVYGTSTVFDPRVQYKALAAHRQKIEFTGYIATPPGKTNRRPVPSFRKKVLVTMGGGEDGQQRIATYIKALLAQPVSWDSHIVTGPLMDSKQVRHFKRELHKNGLAQQVRINRFSPRLQSLLQDSDAVVSMAGYNSCAEIMQSGVPAVLMPRCHPRKEQLIRAQRLEAMGLAQCVSSDDPLILRKAVENALDSKDTVDHLPSLNGLSRLCEIIGELLGSGEKQTSFDQQRLKITEK